MNHPSTQFLTPNRDSFRIIGQSIVGINTTAPAQTNSYGAAQEVLRYILVNNYQSIGTVAALHTENPRTSFLTLQNMFSDEFDHIVLRPEALSIKALKDGPEHLTQPEQDQYLALTVRDLETEEVVPFYQADSLLSAAGGKAAVILYIDDRFKTDHETHANFVQHYALEAVNWACGLEGLLRILSRMRDIQPREDEDGELRVEDILTILTVKNFLTSDDNNIRVNQLLHNFYFQLIHSLGIAQKFAADDGISESEWFSPGNLLWQLPAFEYLNQIATKPQGETQEMLAKLLSIPVYEIGDQEGTLH